MGQMLRFRSLASLLVLALLPALAGCRREPTGTPHRPDTERPETEPAVEREPGDAADIERSCPVDPDDDFCPSYAAALCTAQAACCEDPLLVDPREDCVEAARCECAAYRRGRAFTTGASAWDEEAASALVERLRAQRESCSVLPHDQLDFLSATRGLLELGDDCAPVDDDDSAFAACGPGLYCRASPDESEEADLVAVCAPYVPMGGACGGEDVCALGTHCAASVPDGAGTCAPNAEDGEPCVDDAECASESCDVESARCAPRDTAGTWCGAGPDAE